jgi:hypothetical protein
MSPTTHALVDYWRRLPALSRAERRRALETTCRAVGAGRCPVTALLPAALGDPDAALVRLATRAYLDCCPAVEGAPASKAVDDAIEWVRRGLALNPASVFVTLFATGHTVTEERLRSLRLGLPAAHVAAIAGELCAQSGSRGVQFVEEWHGLVSGSQDPALQAQYEALQAALDASSDGRRSQAAA